MLKLFNTNQIYSYEKNFKLNRPYDHCNELFMQE